jgi:hypothetical protein
VGGIEDSAEEEWCRHAAIFFLTDREISSWTFNGGGRAFSRAAITSLCPLCQSRHHQSPEKLILRGQRRDLTGGGEVLSPHRRWMRYDKTKTENETE